MEKYGRKPNKVCTISQLLFTFRFGIGIKCSFFDFSILHPHSYKSYIKLMKNLELYIIQFLNNRQVDKLDKDARSVEYF